MAAVQRGLALEAWQRSIERRLTRVEILVWVAVGLQVVRLGMALAGFIAP